MALNLRKQGPQWHFWIRLAGLVGIVLVAAGIEIITSGAVIVGIVLAVLGGLLLGLALFVEISGALGQVLSQRGAFGSNVLAQVILAAVLLIGLNVFSFFHYSRFDWTRDREHTIEADPTVTPAMLQGLQELQGETRIVVYQRHTGFGQLLSDKQDNYAAAAERKIVEKVKDLAEQFQELGPRFHVELLDSQEEGFQGKLEAIRKEAPKLAEAIDQAPENSIFFYADGRVQRLAFHDIYELDRTESQKGRGNLVLRFQGRGPFARKVLNIEERRPRIAVATVHPILGLDNREELEQAIGMSGAKKSLVSRGFDTRDIILKKWSEDAPPEPAVLTYDENRYEDLDRQLTELKATIQSDQADIQKLTADKRYWSKTSLDDIRKRYVLAVAEDGRALPIEPADLDAVEKKTGQKFRRQQITEQVRRQWLTLLDLQLVPTEFRLQHELEESKALEDELRSLNIEDLSEQRRISDLRAKLSRLLDDCDLLLLPRLTLINVARGEEIPNRVHRLDDAQVQAIKDFMAKGKPVLFCLGPSNESPGRFNPLDFQADQIEETLGQLGFELPKQTILYTVETKTFGERRGSLLILSNARVEVPPLEFDWRPGGRPGILKDEAKLKPNPIRISMRLAAQAAGKDVPEDMRLRHPRPVYYQPHDSRPAFDPVFLMTAPDAWNESQPFPTAKRSPRYEPPQPDDPDRGTVRERRMGQFPVGVAAEVKMPGTDKQVRLAVIGHGGIFMGPILSPLREKLLLDVTNWLLGRDDLLARDSTTWQYPRVEMSETASALWQWGTRLDLPLLFVCVGFVVLMVRRMR
jgi:hypothetical protein